MSGASGERSRGAVPPGKPKLTCSLTPPLLSQLRESARVVLPVAAVVTGATVMASANDEVVPAPNYPFSHKGPFSSW